MRRNSWLVALLFIALCDSSNKYPCTVTAGAHGVTALTAFVELHRPSRRSRPIDTAGGRKPCQPCTRWGLDVFASDESMSDDTETGPYPSETSNNTSPYLTSEQISRRFRDVVAYFETQSATEHNTTPKLSLIQIQTNLLRTRHDGLDALTRNCRVGTSTVANAGRGVFATRHFATAGELITLYPGDAVLQWDNASHVEDRHGVSVVLGPHIPPAERASIAGTQRGTTKHNASLFFGQGPDHARLYEVRISAHHSVVGDPHRSHDAAYLGHMVNDCAMLTTDSAAERARYRTRSRSGANAQIVVGRDGCHVELVSTRPIGHGDEIFVSYGENYWLTRRQGQPQAVPKSPSATKPRAGFGTSPQAKRRNPK